MTDKEAGGKPTQSKYAIKKRQELVATHANHRPPVHGCSECDKSRP